jgi:hypothetical protein
MNKLYNLLLQSKYYLINYYGEKAFTFGELKGDWSKQFTISKYSKKYVVDGFEGLPNIIKTFKKEFDTYKEVVEYLGL